MKVVDYDYYQGCNDENQVYYSFRRKAMDGKLSIGIGRILSKNFFLNSDPSKLRENFGDSFDWERKTIKAFYYGWAICFVIAILLAPFAFKWYSILVIPLFIILSFIEQTRLIIGKKTILRAVMKIIVYSLLGYWLWKDYWSAATVWSFIWFINFSLVGLFLTLTYVYSPHFLRNIAIRNAKVFHFLREQDELVTKEMQ